MSISKNPSAANTTDMKLRGVNLGSWLVLEKWMVPSLFEGLEATDETTWCAELGDKAAEKLRAHWNTFITREDFKWLAGVGINESRLCIRKTKQLLVHLHWIVIIGNGHCCRCGRSNLISSIRHEIQRHRLTSFNDRVVQWSQSQIL